MDIPRASLLGIPVELRLNIFEFILSDSRVWLSPNKAPQREYGTKSALAYIQICRKIREECLAPFYGYCTFEFRDGFTEQRLQAWMSCVGKEAVELLKKVIFWGRGKCGMFGLQPDTDYCHRLCIFDPGRLIGTLRPVNANDQYCSNRAIGCSEPTQEALFSAAARTYTASKAVRMMEILKALGEDRCESAA